MPGLPGALRMGFADREERADEEGKEMGRAGPEEERVAVAQLCDHAPSSESALILTVRLAK